MKVVTILPKLSPDLILNLDLPQIKRLDMSEFTDLIKGLDIKQFAVVLPQMSDTQLQYLFFHPNLWPPGFDLPNYVPPPHFQERYMSLLRKFKEEKATRFNEPYKVSFRYSSGDEQYKVWARSFHEAYMVGDGLRKQPTLPSEVEVRRLKGA